MVTTHRGHQHPQRSSDSHDGTIYSLNHNLVHKFIPNFSFKGTVTRPPGSRYRACRALRSRTAHINPVERTIQLMEIGSTSPPHELQLEAHQGTLFDLFPDLGESAYENWDLQQGDALQSFTDQGVRAAPDETQHIW